MTNLLAYIKYIYLYLCTFYSQSLLEVEKYCQNIFSLKSVTVIDLIVVHFFFCCVFIVEQTFMDEI